MHECPRDPNFKTGHEIKDETARLMKIKNIKKIFADTQITTTVMLKKCSKIEKIFEQVDRFDMEGLPKDLYE